MRSLLFLDEAVDELHDAIDYYENKSSGLGKTFYDAFQDAIKRINVFPNCGRSMQDGTQRYILKKFPYLIVYQVLGDHIYIIAISHFRRRSNYWQNRMDE